MKEIYYPAFFTLVLFKLSYQVHYLVYTIPFFILWAIRNAIQKNKPHTPAILTKMFDNTISKLPDNFPCEVSIIFVSPKFLHEENQSLVQNATWLSQYIKQLDTIAQRFSSVIKVESKGELYLCVATDASTAVQFALTLSKLVAIENKMVVQCAVATGHTKHQFMGMKRQLCFVGPCVNKSARISLSKQLEAQYKQGGVFICERTFKLVKEATPQLPQPKTTKIQFKGFPSEETVYHFTPDYSSLINSQRQSILKPQQSKTSNLKENPLSYFRQVWPARMVDHPLKKETLVNCTIFNFDIVDYVTYTNSCSNLPTLLSELNNLYNAVDLLVEKFKLEKVYTIGDSYVAIARHQDFQVTNKKTSKYSPNSNTNNKDQQAIQDQTRKAAQAVCKFATAVVELKSNFKIRIGIHSAVQSILPLTGQIIGDLQPNYDIIGPDMKIAQEIESKSPVGTVCMSATTKELVKKVFFVEAIDSIEINKAYSQCVKDDNTVYKIIS